MIRLQQAFTAQPGGVVRISAGAVDVDLVDVLDVGLVLGFRLYPRGGRTATAGIPRTSC